MTTRAYQASATGHGRATRATPFEAAAAFFAANPKARKCNVHEGEDNGAFFVLRFTLTRKDTWPASWRDVTRKAAADLPKTARPLAADAEVAS
jgi:hypothetical protein